MSFDFFLRVSSEGKFESVSSCCFVAFVCFFRNLIKKIPQGKKIYECEKFFEKERVLCEFFFRKYFFKKIKRLQYPLSK